MGEAMGESTISRLRFSPGARLTRTIEHRTGIFRINDLTRRRVTAVMNEVKVTSTRTRKAPPLTHRSKRRRTRRLPTATDLPPRLPGAFRGAAARSYNPEAGRKTALEDGKSCGGRCFLTR